MPNVTMKANDQLHVSSVKADSLQPGEEFEVSAAEADRLEEAGLAKRVGGAKAEKTAPANKMEADPENKMISGVERTATRSVKTLSVKKGKK